MNHRNIIVASIVVAIVSFGIIGCKVTTISPISGNEVTRQELEAEIRKQTFEHEKQRNELANRLTQLQNESNANDAKMTEQYERQVAAIQTELQKQIAEQAEKFKQSAANARKSFEQAAGELAAASKQLELQTSSMQADIQTALDDLQQQEENARIMLGLFGDVSNSFGPWGGLVGAGVGLAGALFGLNGKRNAAKTTEAAGRIVLAIDELKRADPNVAKAFEVNSDMISRWQGAAGKALVDAAQRSSS